jgi:hypothetical protein
LLYVEAKRFVQIRLGPRQRATHDLLCKSSRCASYFGLSTSKAQTTGPFGTVVGPDGWVPYLVLHELIHQAQNEQMGQFRLHPGPAWLLEGMAYLISHDPGADLGPPWQEQRARFDAWSATTGSAKMCTAAKALR